LPTRLSDDDAKLLEEANYGHFATLMPDGSPQVTPVWADTRFLARKYLGVESYPNRVPGERRVIVRIQPEHVARMR